MTIQNQQYRTPIIPNPRDHENVLGSPGHFQYFPVLIIRAVMRILKNNTKIKMIKTAYF
jgi:hypothetical protein